MILQGTHDLSFVMLSIAIAILASFTALNLANQARASVGKIKQSWLAAAAFVLGGSIWSMHVVATLNGISQAKPIGLKGLNGRYTNFAKAIGEHPTC